MRLEKRPSCGLDQKIDAEEQKTKIARDTAKRWKGASRSQQGDRGHFEAMASIREKNLEELRLVRKLVALQTELPSKTVNPFATSRF